MGGKMKRINTDKNSISTHQGKWTSDTGNYPSLPSFEIHTDTHTDTGNYPSLPSHTDTHDKVKVPLAEPIIEQEQEVVAQGRPLFYDTPVQGRLVTAKEGQPHSNC